MMDAEERALFEDAVRRATECGDGATINAALADLGWSDALAEDPATAVSVLFESQGAANVTSSALDQVLAGALRVPGLGASAVVLPPIRTHHAPGHAGGSRLAVRGLGTVALAGTDAAVVVAPAGGGHQALVVETRALTLQPVHGLDPALGLVEVTADAAVAVARNAGPADWDGAVVRGQLALGHELVGSARAMLELARRHALERMQFGRPIASFQAVRHRLAEALIACEAAAGLLSAAWEEPSPAAAALAKGMAGRSARTVARHAQQVLAGIGFTTEHPLHRYVRRTIVLDQLVGAGSVLTRTSGAEVLRSGALPLTLPL
jgi:Acyl-CoA dehydrogenase, C-terminal domain